MMQPSAPKEPLRDRQDILRTAMILLSSWDMDLFAHSALVALDLCSLAPEGQEHAWYWAGLLHDIGKITIAPEILRKPGALDRCEREIVQQHPLRGSGILQDIGAPPTVVEAAKYHHEWWDGTGYPFGLRGQQIPLIARAMAVTDMYAALTRDRPYRRALTSAQAREKIERNAGTQFEPAWVERFFKETANGKETS